MSGSTVRTYTVLPSRRISSLISSSSFGRRGAGLAVDRDVPALSAAHHQIAGAGFDHDPLDVRAGGIGRAVGGVLAVLRVCRNGEGAGEEGGGEGDFHEGILPTRWMSVGREGRGERLREAVRRA